MKRLEKNIEEEVSQTQAGFRRNRGTRDQIFNLRMIIEKCRESNTELHLGFIDYTKAFDCVSHHKMIETLKQYNCHFKIINLIKNLYQNHVEAVRMENGNTEWFQVKGGVRQGCILSPALFSLYTESIMRDVEAEDTEDKYSAIKLNGNPITSYATQTIQHCCPRSRRD
ncbi:retrovirus-related Pol polyprotein from type-1 retrotransposable element R2 [Elysia marginata]|uniref:Retrovirus-related Pol polyprotein from type-1 retrotransposable element R2 n=1 Tax=Elysia marginata TaxID=1093978 RepID=A0AAV4HGW5_9GAST|nr:retrovirus-related Pol polyprotein from type-1 retrotransposable element R2 [Elysia marginata]